MKVLKNENNLCEKHNNQRRNTQKQADWSKKENCVKGGKKTSAVEKEKNKSMKVKK